MRRAQSFTATFRRLLPLLPMLLITHTVGIVANADAAPDPGGIGKTTIGFHVGDK